MTLPRLAFLGTGWPGATCAIGFAGLGFEVLGVDVDEAKIATLTAGRVPFHEPRLDDLLRRRVGPVEGWVARAGDSFGGVSRPFP